MATISPTKAADAAAHDRNFRLRLEGYQFIFRNLLKALPASLLIPVILILAFYGEASLPALLLWSGVYYAVTVLRYVTARRAMSGPLPQDPAALRKWKHVVEWLSWAVGTVWAAALLIFFPVLSFEARLVLLTVANGMCLIALVAASGSLAAFYGFSIQVLGTQTLMFLFGYDGDYHYLGLVTALYLAVLCRVAREVAALREDAFNLKYENEGLVTELREEKERAELANRSKSRFLAAASHDLRQPVHSLALFTEALRMELRDPKALDLLDHVESSVATLDELLTALLDISKLDAGVVQQRPVTLALAPVISRVVSEVRPQASAKNLQLRLHLNQDAHVFTDPVLFSTIFRNLLVNAVNHTREGGVLVGLRRRGENWVVQVWDTGPGIPEARHKDIFVEFVQLENEQRDRRKGLGLGLSICRRLADLLGHGLSLRSVEKQGSVFNLSMVAVAKNRICQAVPAGVEARPGLPALQGTRVLLIDDEPEILAGMRAMLERWGCVVEAEAEASAARARIQAGERFDVYLCDHQLGEGVYGLDLLRDMNALDGGRTRSVLITGTTSPEFIRDSQSAGYLVLHKPVKPAQLRALLWSGQGHRQQMA
ncbi:hybrid sensor histidine kinase/response regulator [Granulosicoccaceae sp. 1_MG-2023]|nr:hybrid sensor histidine kinase/response regulator [Granulosicoccaceae sp. 1_MG-2023]